MRFQLFAFAILLVVVLASGFSFDGADDRRTATCRNVGQTCSSKRNWQCCTGNNCEIPALSSVGTCKTVTPPEPECVQPGGDCTAPGAECCTTSCVFVGGGIYRCTVIP